MPWWKGAGGYQAKGVIGAISRGGHQADVSEGAIGRYWANRRTAQVGHSELREGGGYVLGTSATSARVQSAAVDIILVGTQSLEAATVGAP